MAAREITQCVGIDLGTSTCSIGFWRNEFVEFIPTENGTHSMPAYIAFTETEVLVGEAAKMQQLRNM
jgi:heat shock protein 1/8